MEKQTLSSAFKNQVRGTEKLKDLHTIVGWGTRMAQRTEILVMSQNPWASVSALYYPDASRAVRYLPYLLLRTTVPKTWTAEAQIFPINVDI